MQRALTQLRSLYLAIMATLALEYDGVFYSTALEIFVVEATAMRRRAILFIDI